MYRRVANRPYLVQVQYHFTLALPLTLTLPSPYRSVYNPDLLTQTPSHRLCVRSVHGSFWLSLVYGSSSWFCVEWSCFSCFYNWLACHSDTLFCKGPTHKDSLEYKIWFCTGPNIRLSSYSTPLLKLTHVRFCLLSFIMSD